MALITPGTIFTTPMTVTHTHLNNAIGTATLSNVGQGDYASTVMPVLVASVAPSAPSIGQLWWDTALNQLRMYTGNWIAIAGARGQKESEFTFRVNLVATFGVGMAGIIDTTMVARITTTTTILDGWRFVGISTQAATDGQLARVCHQGFVQVLTGSVGSAGHVLYLSNATEGEVLTQDPAALTAGRPYIGILWETSTLHGLHWAWIWGGPRVLA